MTPHTGPFYKCSCGSGELSWWELDARGIPLTRVCNQCRTRKLRGFKPEVLYDSKYGYDEPIDKK